MSLTQVDSTTLVYLCGLGLPAVVQFYLSLEEEVPEVRLSRKPHKGGKMRCEALLDILTQFEQIAAQLRVENQLPALCKVYAKRICFFFFNVFKNKN